MRQPPTYLIVIPDIYCMTPPNRHTVRLPFSDVSVSLVAIIRFDLKSFSREEGFSGVFGFNSVALSLSDNTRRLLQRWLIIDAGQDALAVEIQRQSLLFYGFVTGLLAEYIEPCIATKRVL